MRFKWRLRYLIPAGLVIYAAAIGISLLAGENYIRESVDYILDTSTDALSETMEDCYDRILIYIASRIVEKLETADVHSLDEMREIAGRYGLDEFNIADSNAVCIASSDPIHIGYDFMSKPETSPYANLVVSNQNIIIQGSRSSADSSDMPRKYLGMTFPDRSGFVQLAIDESRIASEYDTIFYDFFSTSYFTDFCFFIVADAKTEKVVEYGFARDKEAAEGKTLAQLGFRGLKRKMKGSVRLFGDSCQYRVVTLFDRYFIGIVRRNRYVHLQCLFLLVPFVLLTVIFAVVIWRMRVNRRAKLASHQLQIVKRRQEREERQRQAADLAMARNIQRSSLPSTFPPYPRDLYIDIFAEADPARDVGGDFYDFFHVGSGCLAFIVADVSGKGVPAALFMMKAKSILREMMLSLSDLGDAVSMANERLCEGNKADMFVTCWIGVLDERSGIVRYVNAGHNPPYVCRADGTLDSLPDVSGLFLGAMEGVRYTTFSARLEANDMLFLYTDGVTEANNVLGQFFGEHRLEDALKGRLGLGLSRFTKDPSALVSPFDMCHRVHSAVDAFAGKASQFDDITMLAIRYRGKPQMRQLELPAELDSVPKFNAFAERFLDEAACRPSAKADLLVALDEVTNNVAQYSGSEKMKVEIEIASNPLVARFAVCDSGTPWNPLEHIDPDISVSADERTIGGLGILMVKRLMDDVSYVYDHGQNVFRFRKLLVQSADNAGCST